MHHGWHTAQDSRDLLIQQKNWKKSKHVLCCCSLLGSHMDLPPGVKLVTSLDALGEQGAGNLSNA